MCSALPSPNTFSPTADTNTTNLQESFVDSHYFISEVLLKSLNT